MLVDRQTHRQTDRQTDRQTCSLQYFAIAPAGEVSDKFWRAIASVSHAVQMLHTSFRFNSTIKLICTRITKPDAFC